MDALRMSFVRFQGKRCHMTIFSEETVAKLLELPPGKRAEILDGLAKLLAARAEKPYENDEEFPYEV